MVPVFGVSFCVFSFVMDYSESCVSVSIDFSLSERFGPFKKSSISFF